ncbi:hypothetical protein K3F79_15485, partial [Acinetobacter baumannii]|nr:hypothetical protein [Acinetobacter baumannii]
GVPIDDSNGVFEIRRRILNIENGLFPSHKVYNSSALIETLGKCSICKNSFLDCEHMKVIFIQVFIVNVLKKKYWVLII